MLAFLHSCSLTSPTLTCPQSAFTHSRIHAFPRSCTDPFPHSRTLGLSDSRALALSDSRILAFGHSHFLPLVPYRPFHFASLHSRLCPMQFWISHSRISSISVSPVRFVVLYTLCLLLHSAACILAFLHSCISCSFAVGNLHSFGFPVFAFRTSASPDSCTFAPPPASASPHYRTIALLRFRTFALSLSWSFALFRFCAFALSHSLLF
jgi:hypothetical protein